MYTSMHQLEVQYSGAAAESLDHWVAGCSGDTTHVVIVTSHHDVTLHSPLSSPAVCVCVCVKVSVERYI